jgi:hypothetical protein
MCWSKPEHNPAFAPWAGRDDVVFREGRGLVAVFDFADLPASQLGVKVAVSGVSVAGATNPRYAGLDEYMKLGRVAADQEREGRMLRGLH